MIIEPGLARELVLPPWQRGWGRSRREATIGTRIGSKIGTRIGSAIGCGVDPISGGGAGNPMAGVTQDATSGKYVPANSTEWATTFSAAGMSKSILSVFGFQEASGNIADLVGSNTLTVTGASWQYQQAVTGWARKQFQVADGNTNHNAQNTTTAPDIASTSVLLLLYMRLPAATPAATRRFARLDTTGAMIQVSTVPQIMIVTQGVGGSSVSGSSNPLNAVRPVVVMIDKTNNKAMLYTDQEKVTGTQGTYTGLALGVGAAGGTVGDCGFLYGAVASGANAELTDAQVKSLLQTLGWSIPWS